MYSRFLEIDFPATMKFYQSPLFYLGVLLMLVSPAAGYGFFVTLVSGALFLLLDLGIRKTGVNIWVALVLQAAVLLNWWFWGMEAIGRLITVLN